MVMEDLLYSEGKNGGNLSLNSLPDGRRGLKRNVFFI